MPRYKIERYTLEEGELVADTLEDAAILIKYGATDHVAWKQKGAKTIKLKHDKVTSLYDNDESRDNN